MPFAKTPSHLSYTSRAALLALAASALAASTARAQQGITFTYQMSGTAHDAKTHSGAPEVMAMTVRAAGSNMRIEFREGGQGIAMMKPGGYMLLRGADKTFAIVNPTEKTAVTMSGEGLGGMGFGAQGASARGSRAPDKAVVEVSDKPSTFDWEDLGAGEKILGMPTRHVRLHGTSTSDTKAGGRSRPTTDEGTAEMWIATRIPGVDAEALRAWSNSFGRSLRSNSELAATPRGAEFVREFGAGMPLRTIIYATGTDEKGRVRTDTARMEITELTPGKIDPSMFQIPADYKTVDMRGVAKSLDSAFKASGMDTLNAGKIVKDGAKDAAKDAGKDAAKDAVKNVLGGFLHRKKP